MTMNESEKGLLSVDVRGLNGLRDRATAIATAHGFDKATPGEEIALIHSEASEALEDIRAGRLCHEHYYKIDGQEIPERELSEELNMGFSSSMFREKAFAGEYKPCGVPSEMADIVIRVLHFCGKHGIDISRAVREKMLYNDSRPFKHGGKTL